MVWEWVGVGYIGLLRENWGCGFATACLGVLYIICMGYFCSSNCFGLHILSSVK